MTPNLIGEWLAALGTLTAAAMTADDAQTRIVGYTSLLQAKYPISHFSPASLEAVALKSTYFPTYGEVCQRLEAFWAPPVPPMPLPALSGSGRGGAGHWGKFVARRLAEGADRRVILSMIRTHAEPAEVEAIMAVHYPLELRVEQTRSEEVRRDKARAAASVAAEAAKALRPPQTPRSAKTPPTGSQEASPRPLYIHPAIALVELEQRIERGQASDADRTLAAAMRRRVEAMKTAQTAPPPDAVA